MRCSFYWRYTDRRFWCRVVWPPLRTESSDLSRRSNDRPWWQSLYRVRVAGRHWQRWTRASSLRTGRRTCWCWRPRTAVFTIAHIVKIWVKHFDRSLGPLQLTCMLSNHENKSLFSKTVVSFLLFVLLVFLCHFLHIAATQIQLKSLEKWGHKSLTADLFRVHLNLQNASFCCKLRSFFASKKTTRIKEIMDLSLFHKRFLCIVRCRKIIVIHHQGWHRVRGRLVRKY